MFVQTDSEVIEEKDNFGNRQKDNGKMEENQKNKRQISGFLSRVSLLCVNGLENLS